MHLLSILISFATGIILVAAIWQSAPRPGLALRCSFGAILGLGGSSLLGFFWLSAIGNKGPLWIFDLAGLASAIALLFISRARAKKRVAVAHAPATDALCKEAGLFKWAPPAILALGVAYSFIASVSMSIRSPHGEWDAWAIWNLKARFLFRGADEWQRGFSSIMDWSHPDYPLLVPSLVWRGWTYAGAEGVFMPIALAIAFTFLTVFALYALVSAVKGRAVACIGATALALTPSFIEQGVSQCADVPFGLFMLASVACLSLQAKDEHMGKGPVSFSFSKMLFLSGLFAGLSAWTKNEGLLLCASVIVALIAISIVSREGLKTALKKLISLAIGMAPGILAVLYFKGVVSVPSDLFASGAAGVAQKLVDAPRYAVIAKKFAYELVRAGDWIVLGLIGFLAISGASIRQSPKPFASALVPLLLVLAGYFLIYVITPYDLEWHLASSFNRILVGLWPTIIFVFLIAGKPGPEQAKK